MLMAPVINVMGLQWVPSMEYKEVTKGLFVRFSWGTTQNIWSYVLGNQPHFPCSTYPMGPSTRLSSSSMNVISTFDISICTNLLLPIIEFSYVD